MSINPLNDISKVYLEQVAVDEAQKPFPFKKVEKQMEKARKGSVYGREPSKEPAPNVSDTEKKETTRFSKMFHAQQKAKRAKQEADKARRSPTFYKDTHPASAPKMKKANEEVEQIDELSVNKMHDYINKSEKDRDRLNKKWDQGTATPKERKKVFDREEGEARASKKIKQKTGKDSFKLNIFDKLKSAITKEEVEQIDEISTRLAGNVVNARIERTGAAADRAYKHRNPEAMRAAETAADKEARARKLAAGVRTRRAANEEVEIDETSHLEPDMKKRQDANEKAIADMKKTKAHKDMVATVRKKFDEEYVDEALRSREERMARMITPAKRKEQERTRQGREVLADIQASQRALNAPKTTSSAPQFDTPAAEVRKLKPGQKKDTLALKAKKAMGEALDPVGHEDADVDNDGKKNTNADKYLLKRRKAIGKAISTHEAKDVKRWWDDDGDGKGYEEGEVSGKFKRKKKEVKESFSNWREDLVEVLDVIDKEENEQKITEKKVKNKIKINPNMGEAVENLGGTLLEMVEIDEVDYIVESVYDELLEEGYEEDDIEEAIEYSLTEAKVTFGHDTAPEKKRSGLMTAAKERLSSLKKSAKKAVASGARKVAKGALGVARKVEGGDKAPSAAHTGSRKASTYRGAGVGQKEKVSSGSYKAPEKKKSEPVEDPWKGSEVTPKPKSKAKPKAKTTKVSGGTAKAPAKRKRTSKLDDLLASVRSEEVQIDEKVLTAAETKKKEELVKSMKKSASDFETRYPGRGKEVMYATATKMAKKMAEQALEMQPKTSSEKPDQQQKKLQQQQDRMRQQEVQILQRKLQALRSAPKGTDPSITAGYEPEGEMIDERSEGWNSLGRGDRDNHPKYRGLGSPSPREQAAQKAREDASAAAAKARLRRNLAREAAKRKP